MTEQLDGELENIKNNKSSPHQAPLIKPSVIPWVLFFGFGLLYVYNQEILPKENVFLLAAVAAFLLFLSNKPQGELITEQQARAFAELSCKKYYETTYKIIPSIQIREACNLRYTTKIDSTDPKPAVPMYWQIPIRIEIEDATTIQRKLMVYEIDPWNGTVRRAIEKRQGFYGSEKQDKVIIREAYGIPI